MLISAWTQGRQWRVGVAGKIEVRFWAGLPKAGARGRAGPWGGQALLLHVGGSLAPGTGVHGRPRQALEELTEMAIFKKINCFKL